MSRAKKFTEFQKRVYRCVLTIPLGQVRSYKWVAKKIGRPKAVRAVGSALRKNPFTLFIPCHRVVKEDTSFGGYSKGRLKKRKLINLEKAIKDMIK
jgi:methylated-DNA-[protein]-cysteine S-methyltransferase